MATERNISRQVSCSIVGSLDKCPEIGKVEILAAQHSAMKCAADQRGFAFYKVKRLRQLVLRNGLRQYRVRPIHAMLTASQASRVNAVRTIRAFCRAAVIEEITLDGLAGSHSRKWTTFSAL